jgi:hypothetical protein
MNEHERRFEEWASLIGHFILAFGEIELATFMLWRKYFGEQLPSHNFKERTGAVLARLRNDPGHKPQLVLDLENALRVADKRNTVAHHPMCVQVFKHMITDELALEFAIKSEVNDDYIDDQELRRLGVETRSLVASIYAALPKTETE